LIRGAVRRRALARARVRPEGRGDRDARGIEPSMIVEERIYTLQPGKVGEYLAAYQAEGLAIQQPILGNLIGYFSTEFGMLNQVIHLWGYEDLNERERRRGELWSNQRWLEYAKKIQPLLVTQESRILIPAPFSPIR
jgi:hypothetical protein